MDVIRLEFNSQETLSLIQLVTLRLDYLYEREASLTSKEQIEMQALRGVALKIRTQTIEKIGGAK